MTPAVPTVNSAMPLGDHAGADRGALLVARAAADGKALGQPGGVGGGRAETAPAWPDGMPTGGTRSRSMPHRARTRSLQSSLLDVEHAVERQRRGVGDPLLGAEAVQEVLLAVGEPARAGEELTARCHAARRSSRPTTAARAACRCGCGSRPARSPCANSSWYFSARPSFQTIDGVIGFLFSSSRTKRPALTGEAHRAVGGAGRPPRPRRPLGRRHRCRATPPRRPARSTRRGARCTGTPGSPDPAARPARRRS